ncbi:MAG: hypothetical protein ABSH52_20355 [Terriglobia bacterium]
MELERKFVPLMVNVCAAAPAVTEEGERLVILGTGFNVGGGDDPPLPPPPPPQDAKMAKASATRIETTNRGVRVVLFGTVSVSSDMVGYLEWRFVGTDPD